MAKQVLKIVPVSNLLPNPFRNIKDYPIDEEKVESLEESYRETGVWPNITARPAKGGKYEIAYGHHRMAAMKKAKIKEVAIVVEAMTDEVIFKRMVRENDEVYGTSAYGDVETVQQAVAGFASSKWKFPEVPKDTPKKHIVNVGPAQGQRQYTEKTLAAFLGKTKESGKPAEAVKVGIDVLKAIDDELVTRQQIKGLTRNQAKVLVQAARKIQKEAKAEAKRIAEEAKKVRERAEEIKDAHKKAAAKKLAASKERQAVAAESAADVVAKGFVEDIVDDLRVQDVSVRDVAKEAKEIAASYDTTPAEETHSNVAEEFKNYSGEIALWFNDDFHDSILKMMGPGFDLKQSSVNRLYKAVTDMQKRAERFARKLDGWNAEPVQRTPKILKLTG